MFFAKTLQYLLHIGEELRFSSIGCSGSQIAIVMKGLATLTLDGMLILNLRNIGIMSSTDKDSRHLMREALLVSLMLPMNF